MEICNNDSSKMQKVSYKPISLVRKLHWLYSVSLIKMKMPNFLLKNKGYYIDRNECPFTKKNKIIYGIKD